MLRHYSVNIPKRLRPCSARNGAVKTQALGGTFPGERALQRGLPLARPLTGFPWLGSTWMARSS